MGYIDPTSGEYIYDGSDPRSPMPDVLNLGQQASRTGRTSDRARLATVEAHVGSLILTGESIVYRTSNGTTSSTAGAFANVPWTTEEKDELGAWVPGAPMQFTITQAGSYELDAVIKFNMLNGYVGVRFTKNGTPISRTLRDANANNSFTTVTANRTGVVLAAGDYVTVQAAAGSASVPLDAAYCMFRIRLERAA